MRMYDPIEVKTDSHKRATFLVCIPTLGMVPIEFVVGFSRMQMPMNALCQSMIVRGMEIGVARNYAGERLLSLDPMPEYLLFLGDDMIMQWDSLLLLYEEMKTGKWDILTGLYYMKAEPPQPVMGRKSVVGAMKPHRDFVPGDIIPVDLCGLDFTLIHHEVFKKMSSPYFKSGPSLFNTSDGRGIVAHTEDVWFCDKALDLGLKIGVHTGCRIAHFNSKTGEIF